MADEAYYCGACYRQPQPKGGERCKSVTGLRQAGIRIGKPWKLHARNGGLYMARLT